MHQYQPEKNAGTRETDATISWLDVIRYLIDHGLWTEPGMMINYAAQEV